MDIAQPWWTPDPDDDSTGARLFLVSTDSWYHADVMWDGCINLFPALADGMPLHICDLDEFIARLQEIKVHALLHFGDTEWPACAPNMPAE